MHSSIWCAQSKLSNKTEISVRHCTKNPLHYRFVFRLTLTCRKKKKKNNKTTKHTKKDKSAGDCYGGWGNESVKETDIVLIWAGWSAHPRGYSPDIYREQKWPRDPLWPLLSRWINDTFAPPRRPLFCYWLWKQEALGATHILTAAHSLNCVDVHVCVCVCVCVQAL